MKIKSISGSSSDNYFRLCSDSLRQLRFIKQPGGALRGPDNGSGEKTVYS